MLHWRGCWWLRNSHSRNWYCSLEILYNGLSSHSAFFLLAFTFWHGPFRAAGWHPPEMLHSWRKSIGQNDDQQFTSFCMFLLLLCTLRYVLLCNSTNISPWYPPWLISPKYRSRGASRDTSRGMRSASPLVWTCDPSRSWPVLSTMLGFEKGEPWLVGMMDPNMEIVGKSAPKMVGRAKKFWTNAEIYYRNI